MPVERKKCRHRISVELPRRRANALCVEIGTPADRCTLTWCLEFVQRTVLLKPKEKRRMHGKFEGPYCVIKTPDYCSAYYYSEDHSVRATAEASRVGNEWWVNRVLVQPASARCMGLGGQLLEKLKETVAQVGGTSLLVTPGGYSDEWERQHKFYRSHGFQDADPVKDGLLEATLVREA